MNRQRVSSYPQFIIHVHWVSSVCPLFCRHPENIMPDREGVEPKTMIIGANNVFEVGCGILYRFQACADTFQFSSAEKTQQKRERGATLVRQRALLAVHSALQVCDTRNIHSLLLFLCICFKISTQRFKSSTNLLSQSSFENWRQQCD